MTTAATARAEDGIGDDVRSDVPAVLPVPPAVADTLREAGVAVAWLFGSRARGDARPGLPRVLHATRGA